jgi:hypothetical protein
MLSVRRRVTRKGDLSYEFDHNLPKGLFLRTIPGIIGLKKQRQRLNPRFADASQMIFIKNLFDSGAVLMMEITEKAIVLTVDPDLDRGDVDTVVSTQIELLKETTCQIKPDGRTAKASEANWNGRRFFKLEYIPVLT